MALKNEIDFKMYAKNFDKHRKADIELVNIIIDRLKINESSRILDFGCGTGNYLKTFQAKGYNNLFGMDQSEEMCKIASKKTSATLKNGTHNCIPFEDNYFRGVFIVDVIHFIDDIDNLFNSLHRICQVKGRVFIATQSQAQLETRIYSKYFPSSTKIDKLRHYAIDKLTSTAESKGFKLVSTTNYLNNTKILVDETYFNLIQNKSFYILRLILHDEFKQGIEKLRLDMRDGNFIAKFPGRTLITFEKTN